MEHGCFTAIWLLYYVVDCIEHIAFDDEGLNLDFLEGHWCRFHKHLQIYSEFGRMIAICMRSKEVWLKGTDQLSIIDIISVQYPTITSFHLFNFV